MAAGVAMAAAPAHAPEAARAAVPAPEKSAEMDSRDRVGSMKMSHDQHPM